MTSDRRAFRDFNRTHEPGQPVANLIITLSQNVDVLCSLHVRISAGNSAGTSSPSEGVQVGKFHLLHLQESQNQYRMFSTL